MSSITEKTLKILRFLPRVSLNNLVKNPYAPKKPRKPVGQYGLRGKLGYGQKGMLQRQKFLPAGWSIDKTSFVIKQPCENYYEDILRRRQYPPLTLFELQLLIDTNKININEPIDLSTLCNTNCYHIDPLNRHFGVNLKYDGLDTLNAKINIEVQYANEAVIAAIERNGGFITTAYYDIASVSALSNPLKFFNSGQPIPKRLLPPPDCIEYYTNAKNRGYLADPVKIEEERFKLAQKYGYTLPVDTNVEIDKMLRVRKDPRQVFYGLEPGWVVNLKDKEILKPCDELLRDYYKS